MVLRRLILLLLALICGTLFVSADEVSDEERCVEAIFEAYSHLSSTGSHSQSFLTDSCTNILRTWSIYAAVKVYCSPREINPGLKHIDEPCEGELARTPYAEIEPELTDEFIGRLRVVEYLEVPKAAELNTSVLISRAYFEASVRTNAAWSLAPRMHRAYGAVAYWFWGGVLLIGILHKLLIHLFHTFPSHQGQYPEGNNSKYLLLLADGRFFTPFKAVYQWTRTNLIIPAAFGSHHQRLFYYCTIPTRMEAVPIISYYVLSLVFMSVSYDIFEGNLYWNDTSEQFWRYLSDRTGIMAYVNLCLLWLFGGRNNPFLWATGWKFSTFNLFHRTIARGATIEAIVHSVGYTVLVVKKNTYWLYLPSPWWHMGIVATVCMSLLLPFSSIYLRKNYYEFFLFIHISFSIITIICLFAHTVIFSGKYDIYLWPVVFVWSIDRIVRIARIAYCNIHIRLRRNHNQISRTTATVSYNKLSDIIRLEIMPGSSRKIEPKSGQYYYLYQPLKWRGYESHPFTLGYWTGGDDDEIDPIIGPSSDPKEEIELLPSGRGHRQRLVFWIRPFDGWTKRLRNECLRSPDLKIVDSTFLIEGPYGQYSPVHNYENVILIAGGSGIAGVLPYIKEYLLPARRSPSQVHYDATPSSSSSSTTLSFLSAGAEPDTDTYPDHLPESVNETTARTRTRHITLIWTARQRAFFYEIGRRELRPALARDDLDVRLYATATTTTTREQEALLRPDDPGLDVISGRPDIKGMILDLVRDFHTGSTGICGGRTAVLVCGPGGMADEARLAVHGALKEGYTGVEYFEEAFGW